MPLDIKSLSEQSSYPLQKKPSLDPNLRDIYSDVFSIQNTIRILMKMLDNTFSSISSYINSLPTTSSVAYPAGYVCGFNSGFKTQSTSTQAQTAVGNARGLVVSIPFTGKFKVGWRCISYTTATAVRCGLYNRRATNSWLPGTLAYDLGTLTISSTGLILTPTSIEIPAGVYVLVIFYGSNAGTSNTYIYNTCDPATPTEPLPESLYSAGVYPTRLDMSVTYPTGILPDLSSTTVTSQTTSQAIGPRLIAST